MLIEEKAGQARRMKSDKYALGPSRETMQMRPLGARLSPVAGASDLAVKINRKPARDLSRVAVKAARGVLARHWKQAIAVGARGDAGRGD